MNIVIVGGGTAGWIAAYYISKSQPRKHNITVIESSKIGIIGAGEGSTGSMIDLLNGSFFNHKVDILDFMKKTDATYKMGIRHQNWSPIVKEYFAQSCHPTGLRLPPGCKFICVEQCSGLKARFASSGPAGGLGYRHFASSGQYVCQSCPCPGKLCPAVSRDR
jgi:hypothetical protein